MSALGHRVDRNKLPVEMVGAGIWAHRDSGLAKNLGSRKSLERSKESPTTPLGLW
jgi:hypothetical protein